MTNKASRERLNEMVAWCDERLRTHPEDLESLLRIAQCLWDMGRGRLALDYLKRALTHHPGDPRIRELIQAYSGEFLFEDRPASDLEGSAARRRKP
ncbi:MAG: tetratricopeptide repeat protein [Elusimicrobia bacterium]|nr:tetratricopeptide repeat protein [Elusimicrobiota bacterium]